MVHSKKIDYFSLCVGIIFVISFSTGCVSEKDNSLTENTYTHELDNMDINTINEYDEVQALNSMLEKLNSKIKLRDEMIQDYDNKISDSKMALIELQLQSKVEKYQLVEAYENEIQREMELSNSTNNLTNDNTLIIENMFIDMPIYLIDETFVMDNDNFDIFELAGDFVIRKKYSNFEILSDPLHLISIKYWGNESIEPLGIHIGDDFKLVSDQLKNLYENVDTPNGGILDNWFMIDENICLIIISDIDRPFASQLEYTQGAVVEMIEICYLSTYN